MVLCKDCKHHLNTHTGGRSGPPRDIWYYQVCLAPSIQYTHTDCVTGKKTPHRIYCRDINNDLNCPHFTPKAVRP